MKGKKIIEIILTFIFSIVMCVWIQCVTIASIVGLIIWIPFVYLPSVYVGLLLNEAFDLSYGFKYSSDPDIANFITGIPIWTIMLSLILIYITDRKKKL